MNLNDSISALGIRNSIDVLNHGWEEAQECFPGGALPFLSERFIESSCRYLNVPSEILQQVLKCARSIAGNKYLTGLAWYFHYSLFKRDDYPQKNVNMWPSIAALSESMREDAGLFYFLIFLSGLEKLVEYMNNVGERRSIPSQIIHDTIFETVRYFPTYFKETGGFPPGSLRFRVYVNFGGEYFVIGRLAYHLNAFKGKLRAFRHRKNKCVVAISEDGVRYLSNGQRDGPGRLLRDGGTWVSTLTETDDAIEGHPILPTGEAVPEQVRLTKSEWFQVLAPGDTVLEIHIPGGGGMTHELCGKSLKAALDFFPRYFPDRSFSGLSCISWILDAELQELLSSTSNMVLFQKEFHLFPALSDDKCLLVKAFGQEFKDISNLPRETKLQRALYEKLAVGSYPSSKAGGGFLLTEDFHWGAQVYLNRTPDFLDVSV